jgi:hypothetical protein
LCADYTPVELSDPALEAIITNTVRTFQRYKPLIRHENFQTVTGITANELPADVTGVKHAELTPTISSMLTSGMAIESALISGFPILYGVGDIGLDVAYLRYRRNWLKQVSRELGSDPDWASVKDPVTGIWTIYTFSTSPLYLDVHCTIEYPEDLAVLEPDWQPWFVDYVIAESKITVGEARSKFDAIPVAGTKVSMNGSALKSEGQAAKDRLIKDIQASRTDLFPRWAIYWLPMLLPFGASLLC